MRGAEPFVSADRIVERLDDLLRQEATALRGGDFAALPGILERKARLADRLAAERPPPSEARLAGLRARAASIAALLDAARRGLRDGQDRIAALRDGGAGLRTYDDGGTVRAIATPTARIERRA